MRWVFFGSVVATFGLVILLLATRGDERPPVVGHPVPTQFVPLAGGDTFDQIERDNVHCLMPTLAVIKKFVNWTVRIDDMRTFIPNIDAPPTRDATIDLGAKGATFRDARTEGTVTTLTPAIAAALATALEQSCTDPHAADSYDDWHNKERDIRYFSLGYGDTERHRNSFGEDSAARIADGSEIAVALGKAFDEAHALHVSSQLARARTVVVKVSGRQHRPFDKTTGPRWRDRDIVVDLTKTEEKDAADAVVFLDWVVTQPETLDIKEPHPHVLLGTLTVDGKTRPLAISTEDFQREFQVWQRTVFHDLYEFAEANWQHYDFSN